MTIREINKNEFDKAFQLAWTVFQEFEAPDYCEQGIKSFSDTLKDPSYINMLKIYGAFSDENLLGILATRNNGNHIALFFVDGKVHKQGIGGKLFEFACKDNKTGKMTVNSSPYAIEIYHHLGFKDTDIEQTVDGIRFTPMECIIK